MAKYSANFRHYVADADAVAFVAPKAEMDARFESQDIPQMQRSRRQRRKINTFQARVADELTLLPEWSAIFEMLADHAALRDQAGSYSGREEYSI